MSDGSGEYPTSPSALQLALACRQLDEHRELLGSEPIAIVGMGCRFPGGATDPESYWRLIEAGADAVGPVPLDRPPPPRNAAGGHLFPPFGGYLDDIAGFDPEFFGLSRREAKAMDPQQRLLLEVAWETLENAQQAPERLHGEEIGVFIGISSADYAGIHQQNRSLDGLDAYFGTGNAPSVAAGRLAYFFGWTGPTMAVDTSCSSSLVSVHLALSALRQRECRLALAGGVNIVLAPETSVAFTRAGMLSPTGRCRTFRAGADGYVRGEGCGLVLLARLDHALAAGLAIHAVIRGSAVNQDGPSGGLTVPNGPAQTRVIRSALKAARLRPEQVQYVEAHGTATPLGDPIELGALEEAYGGEGRTIAVGSVKTVFGHLESAAGVAGLMKAALALGRRRIPADGGGGALNPGLPWTRMSVQPPPAAADWPPPAGGAPRAAGVSAFGFSGTNVHVVIEEAPAPAARSGSPPAAVLPVSAHSQAALDDLIGRYRTLADELDGDRLGDLLLAAQAGRNHFPHRAVFEAASIEGLREKLAGPPQAHPEPRPEGRRVAFLFTGQASQYPAMGAGLYRSSPPFRAALDDCDAILADCDVQLLATLFDEAGSAGMFRRAAFAQPALAALQMSMVDMWAAWGVRPDVVLGHSLGEVAAAYAAGVLGRRDALRLAAARGRAMDAFSRPGGMIAVGADEAQVAALLASSGLDAEIGVVNAPQQVVLAAANEVLPELEAMLRAEALPARRLDVSHAFHSRCIDPILGALADDMAGLDFRAPDIPFVSTVSARVDGECAGPAYWLEQVRRPVRFADALAVLARENLAAVLEIGPNPLLSRLARAQPAGRSLPCVETLAEREADWIRIARALGALYVRGIDIDWKALNAGAPVPTIDLPLYPFQRRRLWLDTAGAEPARSADAGEARIAYEVVWRPLDAPGAAALPSPSGIAPALLAAALERADRKELERYARWSADLAAGIPARLLAALRGMGWTPGLSGAGADEVAERLGVQGARRPLFDWMLETAASAGRVAERIEPARSEDPAVPWAEAELVERCTANLADVLTGRVDPLAVLAPEGDLSLLGRLYSEGPLTSLMNDLVARLVAEGCRAGGADRSWRVLEVGAGTGSTSRAVIGALGDLDRLHYTFTDVSPVFFGRARDEFAGNPRVDFRTLDLEADPVGQGFRPGEADVIVAANVLHATASIDVSVAGLRTLLAPGGWLVLLEGVQPVPWIDLVFGLTDGWWRFQGDPLRPDHPLLGAEAWTEMLGRAGFEDCAVLRPAEGGSLVSQQAVIVARRSEAADAGAWLLISGEGQASERLAMDLEARGTLCRTIPAGDPGPAFEAPEGAPGIGAAVVFAGLESTGKGDEAESPWRAFAALQAVARAASAANYAGPILCLTRGGAAVTGADRPDPRQAAVGAFVRSLQAESPELDFRLLDLDPADDDVQLPVLDRALAEMSEQQTAWRGGGLHAPRLVPSQAAVPEEGPMLRSDGTYLVTGASGALARELAPWLARAGAGRIVLSLRDPAALAEDLVGRVEAEGAAVAVAALDVADAGDVAQLLAGIDRPDAPLRGIFHLAGAMTTAAAAELDEQGLRDAWQAKVEGARSLDRLGRTFALDHFVLFSSSAAVMPIAGQAAYAAANAALDALAAARRHDGLAGLSVNWGPWRREAFDRPGLERAYAQYRALGIAPLDPEAALEALGRAMGAKPPAALVIDVDWERLARALPSARRLALLRELPALGRPPGLPPALTAGLGRELRALDPAAREARLAALLRETLAAILETSVDAIRMDDRMTALGVDSLMAVEFRTGLTALLGVDIPLSALLGGATLGEIVADLAAALGPAPGHGTREEPAPFAPAVPPPAMVEGGL